MKRLKFLLLTVVCVAVLFCVATVTASAEIVDSGLCGDNVTYALDSDGTLTISGKGAMKNYTSSAPWYSYRSNIKNVIILEDVTNIGDNSFKNCSNLQTVAIPDSVISIGFAAFMECNNIQSITIPKGVTSIGKSAFYQCSSLQNISLADSIASIGANAFYWCSSLQNVYIENLTKWFYIEFENHFSNPLCYTADLYLNNEKVTDVAIPSNITEIGTQLSGCASLINITIPNSVTSIKDSAFSSCTNLLSINIPNSVTSIGSSAFSSCSNLQNITIPNGITLIKWGTFNGCINLQSISIPKQITAIEYSAFENCSNLQSITIPNSVTNIGNYAFRNCSSLQSVVIGDGVTSIGDDAFRYCGNLQCITIGAGVTHINKRAFSDCSNLRCVIFNGTSDLWRSVTIATENGCLTSAKRYCLGDGYASDGKNVLNKSKTMIVYHYFPDKTYTVPVGIKSIEQDAFYNNKKLSAIILPEGLKNIGSYAFNSSNLSCIYMPSSVATIDQYAFNYCERLSDVYFGGTEEQFNSISIGNYNTALKKATIHYNVKLIEIDGDIFTEDIKTFVAISNQKEGVVTVPSTITKINAYAFSDCYDITEILLPKSVIAIGKGAFYNCDGITNISLPNGVTTIEDSTFYGCKELEQIALSEAITSIGAYAFAYCTNLSEMLLPPSLITIGKNAFWGNKSLTYVSLPNSIKSLGEAVFTDCENLEKVCLPEGMLKSIPTNAFSGCKKLKSIFIPKNITAFGDSAFYSCNELSEIYFDGTEAEWDKISIISSNSVIWAANVHFEHSHTNSNWQTIIEPEAHKTGLRSSICDVCSYEIRVAMPIMHFEISIDAVSSTCSAIGYTAGVYCNDCKKYISGHVEIAINASNHVNTKNVPETPATFENVGYTAGVYCNDCKKYISGHVEIPKLVPEFTDSKDAKESGNNIVSNNGLTVAQLLSQAGKGAVIKTTDGKSVENAALIGTGMVLTMADGSKKEIVVYGDVDGDGKISAADARLALRASVGLEKYSEDSCYYKAAKRGSVDKLSAADARLILRASVGLEDPKSWMK